MAHILMDATVSWTQGSAAAFTLIIALVAAWAVDLVLRGVERRLAARSGLASLDASGHTRLRVVRRLVFALIVGTGVFLALLQFDSFDRLASAALASGALISAVVGFAARDSLGNAVAGVALAVSQPIRVGDVVTIGDVRGTVEDVTLSTTWLRTPDGSRHIVPNQVVTTSAIRNDTIGREPVLPTASVWIAPQADTAAALAVLAGAPRRRRPPPSRRPSSAGPGCPPPVRRSPGPPARRRRPHCEPTRSRPCRPPASQRAGPA